MGNTLDIDSVKFIGTKDEEYKTYLVYYYENMFCTDKSDDEKFEIAMEIVNKPEV
jgi:hypothetical protein